MPEMNGIETLKRIMHGMPVPVIMISAHTEEGAELTFKALELGAVDFITKPDAIFSRRIIDIKDIERGLREKPLGIRGAPIIVGRRRNK